MSESEIVTWIMFGVTCAAVAMFLPCIARTYPANRGLDKKHTGLAELLKATLRDLESTDEALSGALTETTNTDLAGALTESQAGQITQVEK